MSSMVFDFEHTIMNEFLANTFKKNTYNRQL